MKDAPPSPAPGKSDISETPRSKRDNPPLNNLAQLRAAQPTKTKAPRRTCPTEGLSCGSWKDAGERLRPRPARRPPRPPRRRRAARSTSTHSAPAEGRAALRENASRPRLPLLESEGKNFPMNPVDDSQSQQQPTRAKRCTRAPRCTPFAVPVLPRRPPRRVQPAARSAAEQLADARRPVERVSDRGRDGHVQGEHDHTPQRPGDDVHPQER